MSMEAAHAHLRQRSSQECVHLTWMTARLPWLWFECLVRVCIGIHYAKRHSYARLLGSFLVAPCAPLDPFSSEHNTTKVFEMIDTIVRWWIIVNSILWSAHTFQNEAGVPATSSILLTLAAAGAPRIIDSVPFPILLCQMLVSRLCFFFNKEAELSVHCLKECIASQCLFLWIQCCHVLTTTTFK